MAAQSTTTLLVISSSSTPTIAALCTQWLCNRDFRIGRVYCSWRSLVLGAAVGVAAVLLAFVVLPAVFLSGFMLRSLQWSALWAPAAYGVNWSTFLGGPVTEEFGWRGFALPRLQERLGPAWGSVVLGVLWAGWHTPLLLIHTYSVPPWAFVLIITSLSVLMTWATNLAAFSIVVPMLMHALFNSTSRVLAALSANVAPREPQLMCYLAATVSSALLAILLTRGRLGTKA